MNNQAVIDLINGIKGTHAFKRIEKVSFLGVVDSYAKSQLPHYTPYSRAEHSEGVLHIAIKVLSHIRMSDEDTRTLVASALAHDLAHPAFSHSLEYAFDPSERTMDHHAALGKLLHGGFSYSSELIRTLLDHQIDIDRLYSVVSGTDKLSFFFVNPINIDTLDGISRPIWSEGHMVSYNINILTKYISLLYLGETVRSNDFFVQADRFWKSKNKFYNGYLSGPRGYVEHEFQRSIRASISVLDDAFFEMDDKDFLRLYPGSVTNKTKSDYIANQSQSFEIDDSIVSVDRDSIGKRYKRVRRADNRYSEQSSVDR